MSTATQTLNLAMASPGNGTPPVDVPLAAGVRIPRPCPPAGSRGLSLRAARRSSTALSEWHLTSSP